MTSTTRRYRELTKEQENTWAWDLEERSDLMQTPEEMAQGIKDYTATRVWLEEWFFSEDRGKLPPKYAISPHPGEVFFSSDEDGLHKIFEWAGEEGHDLRMCAIMIRSEYTIVPGL